MQKWYASHTVCGTFTQIIAYKMPRELKEIINKEQRNKKKLHKTGQNTSLAVAFLELKLHNAQQKPTYPRNWDLPANRLASVLTDVTLRSRTKTQTKKANSTKLKVGIVVKTIKTYSIESQSLASARASAQISNALRTATNAKYTL